MANEEKQFFSIKGMKVTNVREVAGKSANTIFFSLTGNGLGLYNLRIVEGARGSFIAPPQSKGSDGKYYNQYGVYLSDDDQARIIKAVVSKLPKKKAAPDADTL